MSQRDDSPDVWDEAGPQLRAGLARGIALFNSGDHWGSHEAWEAAWLVASTQDKPFLQGLIQAAAAFHKLRVQANPGGAGRLLGRALQRLQDYPPDHHGLALSPLRAQLEAWRDRIPELDDGAGPLRGLPRIVLSPGGLAARLRVHEVLVHPVSVEGRRALLIELRSGAFRGWSECPLPWHRHGTRASIESVLAPALLAEPLSAPSSLGLRWQDMAEDPFAAAALECATWDLWANREGWTLHEALGLDARSIETAATVRGAGARALLADAEHLERQHYGALVLPARPGADRRVLPAVAASLGRPFAIDLGSAYRPADLYALQALAAIAPTAMLRPVPRGRLHEAARLRRWLEVPVAATAPRDEGEGEAQLELGAVDELLVDPLRCGLTFGLALAGAAESHSVPARMRARAITPIGARAALALAMHPAFSRPVDVGRPPLGTGAELDALRAEWPLPDESGLWRPASEPDSLPAGNAQPATPPPPWLAGIASGEPSRLRI